MMKETITLLFIAISMVMTAQDYNWAFGEGGSGEDRAFGTATDNNGNVFVVGQFRSTATFGTTPLSSAGVEDAFLAKYDQDGNFLWATRFGGASKDIAYDVVTDPSGNCYVAGSFRQTAQFGSITLVAAGVSDYDAFVLKADPTGNVIWAKKAGGDGWDECRAIAISGETLFISGNFTGPANFETITIDDVGLADVYVASYNLDGNLNWVSHGGGAGADFSNALTADEDGNVYAAGYFQGAANFGIQNINNGSSLYIDAFVVKYSPTGVCLWAKSGGNPGDDDSARAITVDDTGNIYVAGEVRGSGSFGSINYEGTDLPNIFVAKYLPDGTLQYLSQAGQDGGDYAYGIAAAENKIFITGLFLGTIQFGDSVLVSEGSIGPVSNDAYVAMMDSQTGNFISGIRAGGNGSDAGRALATYNRLVFQAGDFEHATADFGPFTLATNGSHDVFVAKLNFGILGTPSQDVLRIVAYPNPVSDVIHLSIPQGLVTASLTAHIYSMTGRLLLQQNLASQTGFPVSDFSSGLYFIEVRDGDNMLWRSKFLKR